MDRTYNVFVDNGLYVLGYYLDKDIEDITIDDIKNSTEIFANKFEDYSECEYYKKNIFMGFQNSSYTQGLKIDKKTKESIETRMEKVNKQFNLMLNNIGEDEYCFICGGKHIKLDADDDYLKSMSRAFMPHIHANTFFNYTNNLQIVNICPICLYLSMISLYNCTKTSNTLTLYISDDDEFMEDYTYEKQIELSQNISMQLKEDKNQKRFLAHMLEVVENTINSEKLYKGYIQAISFQNSAKVEEYTDKILSNKDLKFIKNLMEKSLLSEFKKEGLFKDLINEQLQDNYISCVFDFNKEKLRVSKELFMEIEEVYSKLRKEKLELIKDICNKIYDNNDKDEIQQLKNINNLTQFQELLLNWNEMYKNKKNINLFNKIEEFQGLCDYKDFKTVKNTMLMQFMLLNN